MTIDTSSPIFVYTFLTVLYILKIILLIAYRYKKKEKLDMVYQAAIYFMTFVLNVVFWANPWEFPYPFMTSIWGEGLIKMQEAAELATDLDF